MQTGNGADRATYLAAREERLTLHKSGSRDRFGMLRDRSGGRKPRTTHTKGGAKRSQRVA